ncbi:hypothetical protein RhiirC2_714396 [Rhizophagus irregularis]|uniref:Uncharacterized protein n=1 Tax=Rhizophagus irregularis TaxID=588596 RepID=A0A2N1MZL6_9GLOM|nr:hypothetical protein RhiirC2_714396 [Rhizophagus irregularis]
MAGAIGVGGGLIASAHDKKFGYGGHRLITQRKQEKIPENKKSFTKVFDRRKRERQLGPLIERDRFKPSQPKMESFILCSLFKKKCHPENILIVLTKSQINITILHYVVIVEPELLTQKIEKGFLHTDKKFKTTIIAIPVIQEQQEDGLFQVSNDNDDQDPERDIESSCEWRNLINEWIEMVDEDEQINQTYEENSENLEPLIECVMDLDQILRKQHPLITKMLNGS